MSKNKNHVQSFDERWSITSALVDRGLYQTEELAGFSLAELKEIFDALPPLASSILIQDHRQIQSDAAATKLFNRQINRAK